MMKKRSALNSLSWSLAILFCGFGHTFCQADLEGRSTDGGSYRLKASSSSTRPGSLPGEAKRKEKSSKGSVVSSHGGERSVVAAPITASSSSSSSLLPQVSLQKSAPRPKGVPKVKGSSKMGHQPIVTPSPKAQPQHSSIPSIEEDIFESWDEIETKRERERERDRERERGATDPN